MTARILTFTDPIDQNSLAVLEYLAEQTDSSLEDLVTIALEGAAFLMMLSGEGPEDDGFYERAREAWASSVTLRAAVEVMRAGVHYLETQVEGRS